MAPIADASEPFAHRAEPVEQPALGARPAMTKGSDDLRASAGGDRDHGEDDQPRRVDPQEHQGGPADLRGHWEQEEESGEHDADREAVEYALDDQRRHGGPEARAVSRGDVHAR